MIGMDIDSVLGDFGSHFLDYLGIEDKIPAKEWGDPRYKDNFHLIAEDWKFWLTMPMLNEPSTLTFKIDYYITARSIPSWVTKAWLDHNGYPNAPVITVGHNGDKLKVMKELGITIMLDDAIHNYESLNDGGITCFMYTRPHNEDYETDMRCNTMQDFVKIVEQLNINQSTII